MDRKLSYKKLPGSLELGVEKPEKTVALHQSVVSMPMTPQIPSAYRKEDGMLSYSLICVISGGTKREREDNIGMAIKRIASSYVYYYNHKYSRDGHLFRERFKSEPVNDIAYFITLLRYIHQNPVKAGMVAEVKDYEFSSWYEYIDKNSTLFPLCDTRTVLNRIPISELNELVNVPLSDDIVCLDIEDASKGRPSDDQVMMLIKEKTGATNSSAFQQLPADIKKSVLIELKGKRASLRQLERLTGISKSMIYRM